MAQRGLEVRFVGGRRVTTQAALQVVRASLAEVNATVCAALGERAVPFFGDEIGLARDADPGARLRRRGGAVGSRRRSRWRSRAGLIPVVAPLAAGPLNVNADEAAAALAVGLGAERLLFVSDVPGLLLGGVVTAAIDATEAQRLLDADELSGGIVPKLARRGRRRARRRRGRDRRHGGGRVSTLD